MQDPASATVRRLLSRHSRLVFSSARLDSARRCADAGQVNQHASLKQRLQDEALSSDAYRKLRQQSSSWFNRGQGTAEELYETFLEVYGDSRDTELLFFSFAGVLPSHHVYAFSPWLFCFLCFSSACLHMNVGDSIECNPKQAWHYCLLRFFLSALNAWSLTLSC
jgi:hypothetical protein